MSAIRPIILSIVMMLPVIILCAPSSLSAVRVSPGADIIITSDLAFTTNPYVSGSGTAVSPYLLRYLDMGRYNIQIKNTTSYVSIRDVTFTQSNRHALYLYNADNILIDNANCTDRTKFLRFDQGSGLTLRNSNIVNIRSNLNMIDVVSSNMVTISDSTFLNKTGERGSWINFDSTDMTNTVRRCYLWGVGIRDMKLSSDNVIDSCTIKNHGISIDNTEPGGAIVNCTVDYPSGAGITVSRSNRIAIKDNRIRAGPGIYFTSSSFLSDDGIFGRIDNNTFESCSMGISTNNPWQNRPSRFEVTDNYFGNCTGTAISWEAGTENWMWDNIFYHNAGTGDSGSTPQVSQGWQWGGNNNHWSRGGKGNFWQNHRSPDDNNDGIVDVNYTITGSTLDTVPYTNRWFDTTPPTITITSPRGQYATNYYTLVTYKCTEVGSGLSKVQRSRDGMHWTNLVDQSHTSFYLKKGTNDIYLRVYDRAGLYGILKKTLILNGSMDPLRFEVPGEGSYVKVDPMQIRWVSIFQLLAVNQTLNIDGIDHYLPVNDRSFISSLPEGKHLVRISFREPYGMYINRSSNFTVDLTPPMLTIASPQDGSLLSNPLVGFRVIASDNLLIGDVVAKIDGVLWPDFDPAITYTRFLDPGDHVFNVTVSDPAGWVRSKQVEFSLVEEGALNGLEFVSPSPEGSYTPDTQYTVRWNYSGPFKYTYAFLRVGTAGELKNIAGSRSWDISLPEEGEYELTLRLVDYYENYMETKAMLYRDSTPPKLFIQYPAEGDRLRMSDLQINWTVKDESPILSYDYTLDGGTPSSTNLSGVILVLAEGAHTLTIRSYDAAGNVGEIIRQFTIDMTPTQVSFTSPLNGSFSDGTDISFTWDLSNPSDVGNLTLFLDEGKGARVQYDVIDLDLKKLNIVIEGPRSATIVCVDLAGNEWNDTVEFIVDRLVPEVGWVDEPPAYTNSSVLNLRFFVYDTVGIRRAVIDIDNNLTNVTGMGSLNVTLTEGTHNLTLWAVDLVGKEKRVDKVKVIVDLTLPTMQISEQDVSGGKATLRWAASDNNDPIDVAISLDGGEWQVGEMEGMYTSEKLTSGPHSIRVRAVDQALNAFVWEWGFNVSDSGGIEKPEEKGSGAIWIILAAIALVVIVLIMIVLIVLLRKPREERSRAASSPRKLSIGAIPAARTESLPDIGPHPSLPDGTKVESTEEGSGYIRPKAKEKPAKTPRTFAPDGPVGPEMPMPAAHGPPIENQAPTYDNQFMGDAASLDPGSPAASEAAPIYYRSPPTIPEPSMPVGSEPPTTVIEDVGPDVVAFDDDVEVLDEMEEVSDLEEIEE